jgi:copper transport protein
MTRRRRFAIAIAGALLISGVSLAAHGGLRRADPAAGAALGASPKTIRLFFTEPPEASLSEIAVVDLKGAAYHTGRPQTAAGDPLSLIVAVRPLERGVYMVNWRVVSAVDGHLTSGSYAFGIGVVPTSRAMSSPTVVAPTPLEVGARWLLLSGLVILTGATVAALARFGGPSDLALAGAGWSATTIGLLLFAFTQGASAGVTMRTVMSVAIGRALLWRAVAVGVSGAALLVAAVRPAQRRPALGVAALGAATAIGVHAAAGHAATNSDWRLAARVFAQWAHTVAIGVWIGGLVALLVGTRGAPSRKKALVIRRFSRVAGWLLAIVIVTGVARTYGEIGHWRDLIAVDYGWVVLLKIAATIAIAGLAAINRWYSVPGSPHTLRPLHRIGGTELGVAAVALLAAAALGALPPPASGFVAPRPLLAAGSDFGTTMRVELTTESDQPGPNRFAVDVRDYDSRERVNADRVVLQFAPIDDPGVPSSSLSLERTRDGTYAGTGADLAFDGRWQVTTVVQRGSSATTIPLQLNVAGPPMQVIPRREASGRPYYVAIVPYVGQFRIDFDPERAGRSLLTVSCHDRVFEARPIESIVVTHEAAGGPIRQLSMRRINESQFASDVELSRGANKIVTVTHGADGSRTRAVFDVTIQK